MRKARPMLLATLAAVTLAGGFISLKWRKDTSAPVHRRVPLEANANLRPRHKPQSKPDAWPPKLSPVEEQQFQTHPGLRALLELCEKRLPQMWASPEEIDLFNQLSPEECRLLILKLCALDWPPPTNGPPNWLFDQMGQRHPYGCASLLKEIQSHAGSWKYSFGLAVSAMARNDPSLAIDWVDQFNDTSPGNPLSALRLAAVQGTASQYPQLAFETADRWELEGYNTASRILASARTLEEKTEAWRVLSERIAAEEDPEKIQALRRNGLGGLAQGSGTQYLQLGGPPKLDGFSFEQVTGWLDGMEFSPDDLKSFVESFPGPDQLEEFPKWITWMQERGYVQAAANLSQGESSAYALRNLPSPHPHIPIISKAAEGVSSNPRP